MTDPLRLMVARHRLGDMTAEEAVAIAKSLVDEGVASQAVFDLSVSEPDRFSELEPHMRRIAEEHGLGDMSHPEVLQIVIEPLIVAIADGRLDPFDGGNQIWLYNDMRFDGLPPGIGDLVADALNDWVNGDDREALKAQMVETARRHALGEVTGR